MDWQEEMWEIDFIASLSDSKMLFEINWIQLSTGLEEILLDIHIPLHAPVLKSEQVTRSHEIGPQHKSSINP